MNSGQIREGALVELVDEEGISGWGEVAPLPKWSKESLKEAIEQIFYHKVFLCNCESIEELHSLPLLSSVSFGISSAFRQLSSPTPIVADVCAFLQGTPLQILEQALRWEKEGFSFAKLKVGSLSIQEASTLIQKLKNRFHLRIDVNKAWDTNDSLEFFSHFHGDDFDYVEEPLQDLTQLDKFPIPFAIDESFPVDISLKQLEMCPMLKAIIYKPTMQGDLSTSPFLIKWAEDLGIKLILGSSFESDVGLASIAYMANSFKLKSPLGIGTYYSMKANLLDPPLLFSKGKVSIQSTFINKKNKLFEEII